MASESGHAANWLPERTENILHPQNTTTGSQNAVPTSTSSGIAGSQNGNSTSQTESFRNIVNDNLDGRPDLHHAQTSSTEETVDEKVHQIQRSQTSKSARERRQFSPIRSGDAEELQRIATSLEGAGGGSITRTSTRAEGLQRRDTLADVHLGDPVLDPKSPEFDSYKWARM